MSDGRPGDPDLLLAAFRDLHAARLHGFALVLALGERATAADLAAETFRHIAPDAPRLRHPERAAATLRAELFRRARRMGLPRSAEEAGRTALAQLGIDGPTATALAALNLADRAAVLAAEVERFGEEDVATILGTSTVRARRLARVARGRFLDHHPGLRGALPWTTGSIGGRVAATAARAMGSGG